MDRRSVFRALKWGAKRNADLPGYHRGIIKSVITGASTFQCHLHAAGLAESPLCPFCDTRETEDAPHAFWRRPAWATQRQEHLGVTAVCTDHLPSRSRSFLLSSALFIRSRLFASFCSSSVSLHFFSFSHSLFVK